MLGHALPVASEQKWTALPWFSANSSLRNHDASVLRPSRQTLDIRTVDAIAHDAMRLADKPDTRLAMRLNAAHRLGLPGLGRWEILGGLAHPNLRLGAISRISRDRAGEGGGRREACGQ